MGRGYGGSVSMNGLPEPSDPPMRASDADREAVVRQLERAYSEGRLTPEEFHERSGAAHAARTHPDLEELVRDLPAGAAGAPPRPAGQPATAAPIVAIFGSAERRGQWLPARQETAVAVFGGIDLDFRDVDPAALPAEVQAWAFFGGIDITVPEGLAVQMTGFSLFGGRGSAPDDAPPLPGRPVLRLHAVALFGGVSVKARPPRRPRP